MRRHAAQGFTLVELMVALLIMALMAVANGLSVITETVFENRFMHVSEMVRMGADIVIQGKSAIVRGVPQLTGRR